MPPKGGNNIVSLQFYISGLTAKSRYGGPLQVVEARPDFAVKSSVFRLADELGLDNEKYQFPYGPN